MDDLKLYAKYGDYLKVLLRKRKTFSDNVEM